MLIDSHANLHGEAYEGDLDAVFERAKQAGITGILAICCRLDELKDVLNIAESRENVWASVGIHPHHAKDWPQITADELVRLTDHPKVVAIGETGLDQYYNHSPEDVQIKSFLAHIEAARQTGLPLVIHCRDADERMAQILEDEMGKGAFKALLHSFTGGADLARRAADLGVFFSMNGIATFKSAQEVRDVVRDIMPAERILIETDCPYLTPVPHRGRRNEPSYLPFVAEKLAEIRGWSVEEAIKSSGNAFFELFSEAKLT